ncbi:unnamed protein product [Mytilus coruscus]|uniref:TIR domain-containing protein n=1 Tax=Mytilus coruscus TaxID=42192 RepID=A0A6J8A5Z8_MYTCO|nr:unnamed protein product [Mytilus coruscus]
MIPNLKYLLVADNMVSYISPNSLRNLTDLELLDFSKNNISTLDKSLLEDNTRLNVIKLGSNPITNIPEGFFRSTNQIEVLVLDSTSNLYVIDARHNQIDRLDSNSFIGLDNLAGLNIFGNKLAYISRNVFRHTPKLQLLQASHNNIKVIETGSFKDLKILKWIFVTHNKLNDISNVFTEMLALIQLHLSNNIMTGFIDSWYFYQSNVLQQVSFANNYLGGIRGKAFSSLSNLQFVDLTYNNISTLQPKNLNFSPLAKLQPSVYFVGNKFNSDCHLEWLRQCLNSWTDSCQGLQMDEFEFLQCYTGYRIKQLALIKNVQLENMLCRFDDPCNVDDILCDCCPSLSCNCTVPCPHNCTCHISFDRHNNVVNCANQHFMEFVQPIPKSTQTLYLDGNNLNYINSSIFEDLTHLKTLYLNFSKILKIESDTFFSLTNLEILYLNENKLFVIDSVFNGIASLRVLNLEHNSITHISNNAFNGTANLETLRLAYNALISLPSYFADTMEVLKELSLSNNPWSCDCAILHNLKEITYQLADAIKDRRDMYCFVNNSINASSEIGTMHNLIELDYHYICPNHTVIYKNRTMEKHKGVFGNTQIEALASGIAVLFLLVIIATIIFLKQTLLQVVIFNKFGIRLLTEKHDENKLYDAFISYSHKDEGFVVHELVTRLEKKEGYKLCLHFRDFPVGACIAETILNRNKNNNWIVLLFIYSTRSQDFNNYNYNACPHPCECYVTYTANGPIVHVFCSISKLSNFDFSRLETNVSSVLHITCESLLHSHLKDILFQQLYSFNAFELSDCSFDYIHEHAFYGLRNLRELNINRARNLSIHDKAFLVTPNIRRLVITNSGVTQFPPLYGLNKIQFINFTNNFIMDISNDNFMECDEELTDLFVLILNNNQIHGINVTFGRFTPNLKYFSITDNMIAHISSQSLLNLTYLELFDLTGNHLSELPSNLLKDNINIKVVGLGPNPISQIDDVFFIQEDKWKHLF